MTARPPRPLSLTAYRLAALLATPLIRPALALRAGQGKEDPSRIGERLGVASRPRPAAPLVWLHAVSVGESLSTLPLIEAFQTARPDLSLLVTSGTRTAAELLSRRLPAGVLHQYAPVDAPAAVTRFMDHWRPDLGLFVESELWPNLIFAARAAGARLALISARMTEKSARAWAKRPAAAQALLSSFELILAQDRTIQARLERLGAKVDGRLNLKRAGAPLGADETEVARLRGLIGGRLVVVAASTHAPEEVLIAQATAALSPAPLLIVVPRHPVRADEIGRALAGRRVARRSAGEDIGPDTDIYLADTLGEMGVFLRLADVAVMGGSFGHGVGGHNPLEPARLGAPAVSGRDVANFADIYAEMADAGAAALVNDETGLNVTLAALLGDPDRLQAGRRAALAFAAAQTDELSQVLSQLQPLLPP